MMWVLILGSIFGAMDSSVYVDDRGDLHPNRVWDVLELDAPLDEHHARTLFQSAATLWKGRSVEAGGILLNPKALQHLADAPSDEPLVRYARESLGVPVDVGDLLYFIDDLLVLQGSRYQGPLYLSSGRARKAGILLHPDDIFEVDKPRLYGAANQKISVKAPPTQQRFKPAPNGARLGPRWTARFKNPASEKKKMLGLAQKSSTGFARRWRHLIGQLRKQGVEVGVHSTVRHAERGYLMWGAFILSQAQDQQEVLKKIKLLDDRNRRWGLNVPIQWMHPKGWRKTISEAAAMAAVYQVVYATERGARESNHYDGLAMDITCGLLPRTLNLTSLEGVQQRFDLSDPDHPRVLSLSKELIAWIEEHYGFEKLKHDYPHWNDAIEPEAEPEPVVDRTQKPAPPLKVRH